MADDLVVGAPRVGIPALEQDEWLRPQSREQALAMLGVSEDEFRDLIDASGHRNLILPHDRGED